MAIEDGRIPQIAIGNALGVGGTQLTGSILFRCPREVCFLRREKNQQIANDADDLTLKYVVHFIDGARTECLSPDSALRVIAYRHRVKLAALVTDKTEERIVVWIYPGENIIAEVIISAG
jgi:hypothetical protein